MKGGSRSTTVNCTLGNTTLDIPLDGKSNALTEPERPEVDKKCTCKAVVDGIEPGAVAGVITVDGDASVEIVDKCHPVCTCIV